MSPKAMMTLGLCVIGAYLFFGMWIYNLGLTKTMAVVAYLHYWQGVDTETAMQAITYLPYVGGGLLVIGWLRSRHVF